MKIFTKYNFQENYFIMLINSLFILFENEFSNYGHTTMKITLHGFRTLKNWLNSDSILKYSFDSEAMVKILLWSFVFPWQHTSNAGYKSNFKLCHKQIVRQDVQIKIEFRANRLNWFIFFLSVLSTHSIKWKNNFCKKAFPPLLGIILMSLFQVH